MTENLPEAPASVTLSVITPKGYPALFTLRESSGEVLIKKITSLENTIEKEGYKPQPVKTFGAKKEVEYVKDVSGNPFPCPMCNVGHVKIINSTKGTFYGCDTSKFNPATKTYEGCKFFTSDDPSKPKAVKPTEDQLIPEDF